MVQQLRLNGIYSLAIKDNSLVKIKEDRSCEVIKKFDNKDRKFLNYTYYDKMAYVMFEDTKNNKNQVYSIDLLNSSYPEKMIFETDKNYGGKDFEVIDNKIYYTTLNRNIVEYDMESDSTALLLQDNFKVSIGSLETNKDNKDVYYIAKNEDSSNVYKLNTETKQTETIINGFSVGYDLVSYKKYLICNVDSSNYMYNSETKGLWIVGPNSNYEEGNGATGKVTFYKEDFVIYTDETKVILKDFNGNVLNEALYIVNGSNEMISEVSMITENELQIKLALTNENSDEFDYEKCVIINLETGTVEETEDLYSSVLNIE